MTDEERLNAWRDTLTDEEQIYADRIKGMDGGSHAVAYIAVEQRRNFRKLDERMDALERRGVWKDGAKLAGALISGIAGTAAAVFANSHGGIPKP
jgi:hypothetical protein